MKRDIALVAAFVVGVIGLGLNAAFGMSSGTEPSADTAISDLTAASGPQKAPVPMAANVIPGDGTFQVGVDISPGIYRSRPAVGETGCSWSRFSGPWNFVRVDVPTGDTFATIRTGDVSFLTHGCAPWQRIGSEVPAAN
jgi:hypothetical protein